MVKNLFGVNNMQTFKTFYENLNQKILYVTIGISGSGKSTYLNKNFNKDVIISPDNIRRDLTGDINNQTQNKLIWESMVPELIIQKLNKYNEVALDATNLNASNVKSLLLSIKNEHENLKTVALVWKPNLDISKERVKKDIENNIDRANIPDDAIAWQAKQFYKNKQNLLSQFDTVKYINN